MDPRAPGEAIYSHRNLKLKVSPQSALHYRGRYKPKVTKVKPGVDN